MTSEPRTPAKSDLIEALRSSGEEFVATVQRLPAHHLERGCYEGGWNARQVLAHVAAIEWTYPRLLEIPNQATPPNQPQSEPPTRPAQGGIDAYNARQVEKRAQASIADLIDEFQRNRATTIAAIENADETLFSSPIRSAGGVTGPLASVIQDVAVQHVLGHARDIARAAE